MTCHPSSTESYVTACIAHECIRTQKHHKHDKIECQRGWHILWIFRLEKCNIYFVHHETHMVCLRRELGTLAVVGERLIAWSRDRVTHVETRAFVRQAPRLPSAPPLLWLVSSYNYCRRYCAAHTCYKNSLPPVKLQGRFRYELPCN